MYIRNALRIITAISAVLGFLLTSVSLIIGRLVQVDLIVIFMLMGLLSYLVSRMDNPTVGRDKIGAFYRGNRYLGSLTGPAQWGWTIRDIDMVEVSASWQTAGFVIDIWALERRSILKVNLRYRVNPVKLEAYLARSLSQLDERRLIYTVVRDEFLRYLRRQRAASRERMLADSNWIQRNQPKRILPALNGEYDPDWPFQVDSLDLTLRAKGLFSEGTL